MLPRFPGKPPRDLSRPLEQLEILIPPERDGERLDVALASVLPWRSRASVRRLIEGGYVRLDRAGARPSRRVQSGDVVVVRIPRPIDPGPAMPAVDAVPVIYRDRWMVAVDKPAGMAVHPAGRTVDGTLIHFLHRQYHREAAGDGEVAVVPRLMHRIDRETSGVVVVGLDEQFHSAVARQFEDREVEKEYLAVVHGQPTPAQGTIDFGIGPAARSAVRLKLEARRDGTGLPSLTHYRVLRSTGRFSLVELRPKTGRTHQLRVHMAAIGNPLVGDKIYGEDEQLFLAHLEGRLAAEDRERLILDRHALHAHRLRLYHPFAERSLTLEAALPVELAQLVSLQ